MTKSVDPMRRMVHAISVLQRDESELVRSVGQDLLRWWYEGGKQPLERALGLRSDPGRRSPHTLALLSRRDDLIKKLGMDFYAGQRAHAAAVSMRKAWSRYASASWPRERLYNDVPLHRSGKPEALFWQIMKIQDRVLSERSIRQILAAS